MSEHNKTVVRESREQLWNHRDPGAIDRYFSPSYVSHYLGEESGPAEMKKHARAFYAAFSNLAFGIEQSIAERDRVACRWWMSGVHTGPFLGHAATGKPFRVTGMIIDRLEEGLIVESWPLMDVRGLLLQLDLWPAPGQSAEHG